MASSQHEFGMSQNRVPMDISDPLFLHSSDHPGMLLVTKQMNGSNFGSWKKSMSIALSVKNKLTFVQGLVSRPEPGDILSGSWQRCNDMVTSWLLNSLAPDIAESVHFSETACEIWKELEDCYGQASGAKLYQLHKEAVTMEQGSCDIAGYYSKFKKVHDELATLKNIPPCTCNCGYSQAINKFEESQHLVQFLMGLNSSYNAIRGNILMLKPLPTISQAYSVLVQEEKQREMQSGYRIDSETSAFLSDQNRRVKRDDPGRGVFEPGRTRSEYRKPSSLLCTHCWRPGHVASRCYKLIGYPREFQFSKDRGRRIGASMQVEEQQQFQDNHEEVNLTKNSLTNEEQNQLMHLISKMQVKEGDNLAQAFSHAHFAGISSTTQLSKSLALTHKSPWIIDSGASNHMCFERNLFEYLVTLKRPFNIIMPNGQHLIVTQMGKIRVLKEMCLEEVLFVPQFRYNLLFVGKLSRDMGVKVTFTDVSCVVQGLTSNHSLR